MFLSTYWHDNEIFKKDYVPPKKKIQPPTHFVNNEDGFFTELTALNNKGLSKRCGINFTGDTVLERRLEELKYREKEIAEKIKKVSEELRKPKMIQVKMTQEDYE